LDKGAHWPSVWVGDSLAGFGLNGTADLTIGAVLEPIATGTEAAEREPQVPFVLEYDIFDQGPDVGLELVEDLRRSFFQEAHVNRTILGWTECGEIKQTTEDWFFGDLRNGPTVE
jgi:hypothetical protein